MRIPATPPHNNIGEYLSDPQSAEKLPELQYKISSAKEYLHWDLLRRKKTPENVSAEFYWAVVKLVRMMTRVFVPLVERTDPQRNFHYTRPDSLLAKLRQIDLKAGGLVTATGDTGVDIDSRRYLTRSILEEPFSSSVLEGAATTRERAREIIDQGATPLNESDRMVLNNYRAMMFIKNHKDEMLTPELICQCHKIITEGTLKHPEMGGRFRDNNDVDVADSITGDVFHIPPNFTELDWRMSFLCDFANAGEGEEIRFIHPVIRAIVLHFMLSFDHPFVDGNGRTARALFYWSMLRSKYWLMEYVSISTIIKRAPKKYGLAFLHTETDEGDLTYFILHQLDIILTALDELDQYLDRQKRRHAQASTLILDEQINRRQRALLIEFSRRVVMKITIKQHKNKEKVSYLTARSDLENLAEHGWLTKDASGRPTYYSPGSKLRSIMQ
ncbi:Fic family protein [Robiginitomaculum antarcticum]|uniref:Fic family protein n=1 Tax=Robiginitomaculum antarcticum TaxID=437507 RepID=UPI00035F8714|nr:Fic family protein [Robiginitomaculum antarcticum]